MSAPDSPSSKARPSLLSETAKSAADNDSRILANLEGRVAAQPSPTRRPKKLWIAVVAAALGLSAFGAWQWQQSSGDDGQISSKVAATAPAPNGVQKAVAAREGSAAVAAVVASGAAADTLKTAASAPQPAVIVADTPTGDRSVAAPAGALASAAAITTAASSVTTTTAARASDSERLSRALTEGAPASGSAAAPTAHAKSAVAARQSSKTTASHNVGETDKKNQTPRVASAQQRRETNVSAKKTDQDVDLLTALVARTKPYDASHAKTSAKTASSLSAQKTQTASSGAQGLAERVADCAKHGLIEGQFCRWHVCADHWGKDPSCPSSTFQSGSNN